jgi:septal ring factor EnvC (AmiA/AmiB activator)
VGQRKQLWILLSVFVGVGLFAGLTMWQISQMQQKDRDIARVKTELEQTKQQIQLLQDTNKAAISSRGKLQKDFTAAQKLLTTFQQKGQALEKQLKDTQEQLKGAQDVANKLNAEKVLLKTQLDSIQQSLKAGGSSGGEKKPSSKATLTPNTFRNDL